MGGRWRRAFTIAYGEILTAERRGNRQLQLHTLTGHDVTITCGARREEAETQLRSRGVRIVDRWGAIIAPTLLDFEEELAREPVGVRQSSDNA